MSVKFLVVVYLFTVFNNSGLLFSNRAIDTVTGFPIPSPLVFYQLVASISEFVI